MMRSAKKTYEIDMLHGAILPKLLRFAVPLTLSTMLQLLFNAADVVVVGRWAGDNSLAAVGSNTSLIALFYGLDAIMDVIVGSLRGVGYNILPMLVTLMGACASRLIWLSTVFRLPAYHRIEMVYIVYPLSWALTATTHLICYFFVSRKVDRELRAHEAELAARMEESPEEADS